ncbi:MAG: hypothetical protein Q4D31_04980, partial [Eubacteriales bacterium]|nr:hypothetical protein [Eubacteriales bacterium]
LVAVALVRDKRLFTTAPKDIQTVIQDRPEWFPGARPLGWLLLILCLLAFVGAFLFGAWNGIQKGYTCWQFFGRFLTMLYLMKAFDMIFLDWYLLTRSRFFQHFYPETEGCASYQKYGFNLRKQLAKLALFPFLALLLAWVCTLF